MVTPPSITSALAGHEPAGRCGQVHRGAGDFVRVADAAQRGLGVAGGQLLGVVPQGLGEIGLDQARGDAVDADVVRAQLAGQVARQLHVGGLADAVGADHGGPAQPADRRDDDDAALAPRAHLRRHHLHQPVVGDDVVVQDLAEGLVADLQLRAVVGVAGGVAHQGVDAAPGGHRFVDQALQCRLVADAGSVGDGGAGAMAVVDDGGHLVTRVLLARRDDDLGAVLGHALGDGPADAA
jgi:hypothetical protein